MTGDEKVDMDRAALGAFLLIGECKKCTGKGGFLDTTYDRTGEWSSCRECGGTGRWFDPDRVRKLLNWEPVPHD